MKGNSRGPGPRGVSLMCRNFKNLLGLCIIGTSLFFILWLCEFVDLPSYEPRVQVTPQEELLLSTGIGRMEMIIPSKVTTGVYGGGTLICSAPHGTADGPETVDMVRLFAHITGSICLTVSGFLETGIDKGFRVNVNRNTEKHWTRTGSGTDPSSVWNTYEKATIVSAAANHWYENAVRCAVDYPDIFSDSPSASSGGALRGTFPFAVQHHSFVKQEGVNILQTGAGHGQGYRHNETVRTPYFNSEPLRPSTLHIYPLPPSLYCPAMPTSKKLGMFVELHFNSNPDFVRQMHIASKGVNVVEGQCIIDHISAFVAYDHNKIGTQTVEPLELVVEPVMSSWYSFRSTTSVSRWTNKGMIVELNSKLPHSVKNLYISAFSFAVINCFN